MSLLSAQHLSVRYGHQQVIHELSLHIAPAEILMLMGPNGAGKSTLLKALFGLVPHTGGEIHYDGKRIVPRPQEMVKKGVSFVPQGNTIFSSITIEENLRMGAFMEENIFSLEEKLEEVLQFFPVLSRKKNHFGSSLSGGERQILALGRALMTSPKLLILDEPSIGLAPKIVSEVFDKIQEINEKRGTSMMIVEHNLKSLLRIAHRGVIMVSGKIMIEGPVEKVSQSDFLEKAFFGELS